jgi:hypothetical protein
MKSIDILQPGTEVVLDGDIEARILSVCISGEANHVTYECSWWSSRDRRTAWIPENELKVKDPAKSRRMRTSFKGQPQ